MDELSVLNARVIALRDVVVRLVAYEAWRRDDPEPLFQAISGATERRIHRASAERPPLPEGMHEEVQKTVDLIVRAARPIATGSRV